MKLMRTAVAIVTLGVGVQKDQLIQAVGRMRELGPGRQTVRLAVPSEVCVQLEQADKLVNANGILNWCIGNSISQVALGLSQWASQGLHFHALSPVIASHPSRACEDVSLGLEEMYKNPVESVPVVETIQAQREHCMPSAVSKFSDTTIQSVDGIIERVEDLGAGVSSRTTSGIGEECERELENERELQEETEKEVKKSTPCSERDWEYSEVLRARKLSDVISTCAAVTLESFIGDSIGDMGFANKEFQNIYATENFCRTVESNFVSWSELQSFLRNVDTCIVFGCHKVLLVSEREADCLLELFWESCAAGDGEPPSATLRRGNISESSGKLPMFFTFRYLSQSKAGENVALGLQSESQNQGANSCTDDTLGRLQVFNGDTNFRESDGSCLSQRLEAVRRLVKSSFEFQERSTEKSTDILTFAVTRGKSIHIDGSDLQRLLLDN